MENERKPNAARERAAVWAEETRKRLQSTGTMERSGEVLSKKEMRKVKKAAKSKTSFPRSCVLSGVGNE